MNCVWIYGRVESTTRLVSHRCVAIFVTAARLQSWRGVSRHTVCVCVPVSVQWEAGAHRTQKPRYSPYLHYATFAGSRHSLWFKTRASHPVSPFSPTQSCSSIWWLTGVSSRWQSLVAPVGLTARISTSLDVRCHFTGRASWPSTHRLASTTS